MKQKNVVISALMTLILGIATQANATIYSFNFTASNFSYEVAGTLTTDNVLNGVFGYNITSITGAVTGTGGGVISALVNNPNQPNPIYDFGFKYDNNLSPTDSPQLNNYGVLFTANGSKWNLFSNSPSDYELKTYGSNCYCNLSDPFVPAVDVHGTFSTTPVPEPETYGMMLVGLGLIGFMVRRKDAA